MTKVKQIQQLEERYKKERTRALHFIEVAEVTKTAAYQQQLLLDAILGEIVNKYGTIEIPNPEIGRYQLKLERFPADLKEKAEKYIIKAEKIKPDSEKCPEGFV